MKKLSIFLLITVSFLLISVNSRNSQSNFEVATVDTAPGTEGYWTRSTNASTAGTNGRDNITFFISGTGSMTVTIQFNSPGSNVWTDYDTYTSTTRVRIEDGSKSVLWRAGVKNGEYSSGSLTFGFDW
jgi:hypothetical protein